MSDGFRGRWGAKALPEVAGVEEEPQPNFTVAALSDVDAGASLCEQIATALDGHALAPLAKQAKVSVNTLVRAKAGEGIRLETLEKVAKVLGWNVVVYDRDGTRIA